MGYYISPTTCDIALTTHHSKKTMSLQKLYDQLNEKLNTTPEMTKEDILGWIKAYNKKEQETYSKNKENKALTFGKYKGYTVKELSLTPKGKDYIQWLLNQNWFVEDKFATLYEEIKAVGIKKKPMKKASLD